jgi:SAM-dependent methyltransferase
MLRWQDFCPIITKSFEASSTGKQYVSAQLHTLLWLTPLFSSPFARDDFFQKRKSQGTGAFEWYGSFADISASGAFTDSRADSQVLVLGCGNSQFSADFYDKGYRNITNVDFSGLVIEDMAKLNAASRPSMQWHVADFTDMHALYEDGSFDLIFDKGIVVLVSLGFLVSPG